LHFSFSTANLLVLQILATTVNSLEAVQEVTLAPFSNERTTVAENHAEAVVATANVQPATTAVPVETAESLREKNQLRIQTIMAGYLKHLEAAAVHQVAVQDHQEKMQAQIQENIKNAQRGIYTPAALPTLALPTLAPLPTLVQFPTLAPVPTLIPAQPVVAAAQPNFTAPTYANIQEQIAAHQATIKALNEAALTRANQLQEENQKRIDEFQAQQRTYLSSLGLPTLAPLPTIKLPDLAPPPAINPAAFGPSEPMVPTASGIEATTAETTASRLKRQTEQFNNKLKKEWDDHHQKIKDILQPATTVPEPATATPLSVINAPVSKPVAPGKHLFCF
jgi:F0F1-type ATP synthase delta subunit